MFFCYICKILFVVFLFTKSSTSFSETVSIKGLVFSDFRINKVIANNKTTSGYLTIENTNKKSADFRKLHQKISRLQPSSLIQNQTSLLRV